ncbi:hypothetical protein [Rhizobium sp. G21]|uniref:hypothetical protein n=1 Tax=Rhizobium sp. G21 TaxID=2758439 RepID=UPI001FEE004A|nr:hypothetical protein [Rhizobium sp. G21]
MSLIRGPELLRPDHTCAHFDCGKHALNEWLATHALSKQSKGFSRVIVMAEAGRVIAFTA